MKPGSVSLNQNRHRISNTFFSSEMFQVKNSGLLTWTMMVLGVVLVLFEDTMKTIAPVLHGQMRLVTIEEILKVDIT